MPSANDAASTSNGQLSSLEIIKRRRKCSKLLFGLPDHNSVDEWLNRHASDHSTEARSRWGFDFDHGVPLANGGESSSNYIYEPIAAQEVPRFYRTTPAKRRPPPTPTKTPNDDEAGEPHKVKETFEIKRSISTPVVAGRSVEHKKVVTQTTHRHLEAAPKSTTKTTPRSQKKRRAHSIKSPRKRKSGDYKHAVPAKVY